MEEIKEKKPGSNKILIAVIVFLFLLILIAGYIIYRINKAKESLANQAEGEIKKTIAAIKSNKKPIITPPPQNITVISPPSANGQPVKQEIAPAAHPHTSQPPMLQNTTLNPIQEKEATTGTPPPEVNSNIYVTSQMVRIYASPDTQSPILDEKKPLVNGRLHIGKCVEVISKTEGQPRWLKMKPVNLGEGIKEAYVREDFVELFSN